MSFLYLTADKVGIETGGGVVTANELAALHTLGNVDVLSRPELDGPGDEPWKWDECARDTLARSLNKYRLCHGYAGTFGATVSHLKDSGCKVCWTIAAHDRHVSRREHENLNIHPSFDQLYPHLVEEELWQRYISGYAMADGIVCPSTAAARIVRGYGPAFADKRIEVIPHGCHLPDKVVAPPKCFTVGYLGSFGYDKGVRYLIEAWGRLNWPDATLLLAGRDSTSPGVRALLEWLGGGNVRLMGWVKNTADFYDQISMLVQPSATEGFGIEVVESLAHGRPVLCSTGAGAADLVPALERFPPCDAAVLADRIQAMRWSLSVVPSDKWREHAERYRAIAERVTWDKVRDRYVELWREMLA